jgi:hypothetical protein
MRPSPPPVSVDCQKCGQPGTLVGGTDSLPLAVIHTEDGTVRYCQLKPTPAGQR